MLPLPVYKSYHRVVSPPVSKTSYVRSAIYIILERGERKLKMSAKLITFFMVALILVSTISHAARPEPAFRDLGPQHEVISVLISSYS